MNKIKEIEKSMSDCLLEAFKNNAIITSDGLAADEFIFVSEHKAYYEDGGCLGSFCRANEFLNSMSWTKNHKWYIIGYLTQEEVEKIKEMKNKSICYDSKWHKEEIRKIIFSCN